MSYPGQEFEEQRIKARRLRQRLRRSLIRDQERARRHLISLAKRSARICIRCEGPADCGTVECSSCRVYTATYQRSRYHGRKAAGLCVDCGKPADKGTRCRFHAARRCVRRKFFGRGPGG